MVWHPLHHPIPGQADGHIVAPPGVPEQYVLGSHVSIASVAAWRSPVAAPSSQMCTVVASIISTRVLISLMVSSVIVLLVHTATVYRHIMFNVFPNSNKSITLNKIHKNSRSRLF